jgi:membrane-associated phospholipid phosphatase
MQMKAQHWVALWLGLTVIALPVDQWIQTWTWGTLKGPARVILTSMDFMSAYPTQLLILSILAASVNPRPLICGYLASMTASGVLVEMVKVMVGRARPLEGKGAFHFQPFTLGMEMTSFPSGDAAAAMALATLLGIYFPRSRWCFWVLGLASGMTRVARGRHFLSDVLFGAGMGVAVVLLAVRITGEGYFTFKLPQEDSPCS